MIPDTVFVVLTAVEQSTSLCDGNSIRQGFLGIFAGIGVVTLLYLLLGKRIYL